MKAKIISWDAVATWRWDMPEDEVCGICRVQYDGTCPSCKYPGDECPLGEHESVPLNSYHTLKAHSSVFLVSPCFGGEVVVHCVLTGLRSAVIGKCTHSFHLVSERST